MNVQLEQPGIFVLATSGGVDSMALLNLLSKSKRQDQELIVAHLDHGIRSDSKLDRKLVEKTAEELGLPFIYKEANLGPNTSEDTARQARYKFLRQAKNKYQASAIVTAHHQDDQIETVIINLIRGSNRKGLSSLSSSDDLIRPLLKYPKDELIEYARDQGIVWREDSTNDDINYLRNYIRHKIVPRLDSSARSKLVDIINKTAATNIELDSLLDELLKAQSQPNQLDRQWFNSLPHDLAREVLAAWLRSNNIRSFDSTTLERLVVAAKVSQNERLYSVQKGKFVSVKRSNLALVTRER
jgi:tRNA(Ile)-lysidine synthetase-like protein